MVPSNGVAMSVATIPLRAGSGLGALETRYAPLHVLAPHYHARASLSLVFAGSQRERVGRRAHDCPTHSAVFKTAEVDHSDYVGGAGMHGLLVELEPDTLDHLTRACGRPPDVVRLTGAGVAALVRRAARELRHRRPAYELAVEGLVHELLAAAARDATWRGGAAGGRRRARRGRPWLDRALEALDARFREPLSLAELAREVGVHPGHLAEAFRERFGWTPGGYVRARRVEYARAALLDPARRLSAIALDAGFADQSHLTRVFRDLVGTTPAEYRRQAGRRRGRGASQTPQDVQADGRGAE